MIYRLRRDIRDKHFIIDLLSRFDVLNGGVNVVLGDGSEDKTLIERDASALDGVAPHQRLPLHQCTEGLG